MRNWVKSLAGIAIAVLAIGFSSAAHSDTRTLKLHFVHTGEKAEVTFKRNGKYVDSGLAQANKILRDFRRNEPTKMDPKLLDLVWEVYRATGSKGYVNVISAYRSPTTNNMLRSRGRGVAKNSQHTLGKAMDFFLTDVKLSTLREVGLKLGAGGVGFYPTSGSPFVHLDTGRVRHWPRMSRQELARIFPDGKTMHMASDGKPLPRYEQALAEYKAKGRSSSIVVASAEPPKKRGFFQQLAGKDDTANDEDEGPAPNATSAAALTTTTDDGPVETDEDAPAGLADGVEAPAPPKAAANGAPVPAADVGTGLPQNVPVPQSPERSGETELTAQTDQDEVDELAGLQIPVPTRRPELVTTASVAQPAPDSGAFAIAALTPEEIENLRRNAMPAQAGQQIASAATPAAKPARSPSGGLPKVASTELALLGDDDTSASAAAKLIATKSTSADTPSDAGPSRKTLELALAATTETANDATQAIRDLIETAPKREVVVAGKTEAVVAAANSGAAKQKGQTWKDRVGRYALAAVRDIGRIKDMKAPGYSVVQQAEQFVVAEFSMTPAAAAVNHFATKQATPQLTVRKN